jgi:regulator of protease activity HflC (stomatin/prohibitin superfamily)
MISLVMWILAAAWAIVKLVCQFILNWAWHHPVYIFGVFVAFLRMWGTLVQTGEVGVLFNFGRASRTLEPGFHPLIPIMQQARTMPARSITVNLPPQRLTTADGLVFDIDATLVCRITDPIKATTEIDDLRAGLITALSLSVAELLGHKTQTDLATKAALDAEISERVQAELNRWGVTVEQAGLNTIAPTRTTTRLSQQQRRLREREAALEGYLAEGVPLSAALALLGTTRQVVGHSRARYHRQRARQVEMPPPVYFDEDDLEELLEEDMGY